MNSLVVLFLQVSLLWLKSSLSVKDNMEVQSPNTLLLAVMGPVRLDIEIEFATLPAAALLLNPVKELGELPCPGGCRLLNCSRRQSQGTQSPTVK